MNFWFEKEMQPEEPESGKKRSGWHLHSVPGEEDRRSIKIMSGAERRRIREIGPVTIGIASAGRGCGATHFTLLFANYLAAVERKRTAVLEWKGQSSFSQLGQICSGKSGGEPFSVFDVDYFPQSGARELGECMKAYQVLLIDFGSLEEENAAPFFQCSICCFLASLNEWKLGELLCRRDWMQRGRKHWNYLMVFGSEEARREMKRRCRLAFRRIPFAPDAFSISRETAVFLAGIWTKSR